MLALKRVSFGERDFGHDAWSIGVDQHNFNRGFCDEQGERLCLDAAIRLRSRLFLLLALFPRFLTLLNVDIEQKSRFYVDIEAVA